MYKVEKQTKRNRETEPIITKDFFSSFSKASINKTIICVNNLVFKILRWVQTLVYGFAWIESTRTYLRLHERIHVNHVWPAEMVDQWQARNIFYKNQIRWQMSTNYSFHHFSSSNFVQHIFLSLMKIQQKTMGLGQH